MKGRSKQSFEYTMQCDEGEPPEEQTTWILKPVSPWDSGSWVRRFQLTQKTNKRGFTEVDAKKFNDATFKAFCDVVVGVKNFEFSTDFPELEKLGWTNIMEDDVPGGHSFDSLMFKLYSDLVNEDITELIDAADKAARPSTETKKKSNSKPGGNSGDTTTRSPRKATTAEPA